MKKISILVLVALTIMFSSVVSARGENFDDELTPEEAFALVSAAKDVYCRFYSASLFTDYINVYDVYEMRYDERDIISSTSSYSVCGYHVYLCNIPTERELSDFLGKTFTPEMIEIIKNESRLLYNDGLVYYPDVVYDPGKEYILAHEQMNLTDLIDIFKSHNGIFTVQFKYWIATDIVSDEKANTSYIKVKQTPEGFRICDYDDLFIKKDELAINGYRKYKFTEMNPETADSPIIAVGSIAISVIIAMIILKRKNMLELIAK